ncbi:MAG TPA: glycosyltransferase family 2 protein [Candidatus Methylacidiphilales bacterium]|nr:glycosyltransferase family 2 protein [Candidatus Methylacidiphilales bacterium]
MPAPISPQHGAGTSLSTSSSAKVPDDGAVSPTFSSLTRCLVLIPVRNEGSTIGKVVAGCRRLGATVWIIDNGSTDATPSAAAMAGARVLTCSSAVGGKTAALRFGLSQLSPNSEWDWICFMDGDGQHRPEELPVLWAAARQGADVVLGNRFPSSGTMPFARFWTNRMMSSFLNMLGGGNAPDTQCGYRLVRRSVLQGWLPSGRHYEFETELYLRALNQGAEVQSVPIPTIYAGERSKIFWPRDSLRFLACIWRYITTR